MSWVHRYDVLTQTLCESAGESLLDWDLVSCPECLELREGFAVAEEWVCEELEVLS